MASVLRRAVALALAALFLSAGIAFAGGDDPGGHGVTVTHFTAFGNCSGDRIVKRGPKGFVEDVEVCVMPPNAYGLEPGTYSIFVPEINGWFSDYDYFHTKPTDRHCEPFSVDIGFCFRTAVTGTIVVTKGKHHTFIWNVTTFY